MTKTVKCTEKGFENLKYKLPKTGFHLYPTKDDWSCWSIGYSADKDEVIRAIEEILQLTKRGKCKN